MLKIIVLRINKKSMVMKIQAIKVYKQIKKQDKNIKANITINQYITNKTNN